MPLAHCNRKSITDTEGRLLGQLGYDTMTKGHRCALIKAIRLGKFSTIEEIHDLNIQDVRQHIDKAAKPSYIRNAFRVLLRAVDRSRCDLGDKGHDFCHTIMNPPPKAQKSASLFIILIQKQCLGSNVP